jgi:glycosyltransferase involved in cell wall biosynthesis
MGTTVSVNLKRRKTLQRWVQLASIRLFYRHADGIIVPSRGAAEDLASIAALPVDRISVVPSPILTPAMLAMAAQAVDHPWLANKDCPLVVGVGELSQRKDFATLIRAFARVRKTRRLRLMILGDGRQALALKSLADDLGVAPDVDLVGFKANPYPYIAGADVFALSSTCEGSPVVLMEAQALGVPSVSTDCPSGPKEIFDGERFGRLAPVGDDRQLAGALIDVLDNPVEPAELRAAAQRYTLNRSVDLYLGALGLTFERSNRSAFHADR